MPGTLVVISAWNEQASLPAVLAHRRMAGGASKRLEHDHPDECRAAVGARLMPICRIIAEVLRD